MESIRDGRALDKATLERLYVKLEKPMFNVVYRWLWNNGDAQDVVQEAFLKIWKVRDDVDLAVPLDDQEAARGIARYDQNQTEHRTCPGRPARGRGIPVQAGDGQDDAVVARFGEQLRLTPRGSDGGS